MADEDDSPPVSKRSAKAASTPAPASSSECCNCKKPVGDEPKVHPMRCAPADDLNAIETWCPGCFVYKRARMEPGRWAVLALHCGLCGFETLHIGGTPACGNCKATAGVVLLSPGPALVDSTGALLA